ncbi:MAG: LppX_LprAFG lipoprotein [Kutzneria sp.]|nr:LppX_LprAFG lipoprotein [Kutzneria sp.]MBV9845434.1 LppX_LprAFG lipoprotein [Kutzneria sp.]
MAHRCAVLGTVAALAALTAGCTSGSTQLPDGGSELARSADVMRSVHSTHFAITVDGDLPEVPVRAAEGDLTSDGAAKGTAKITEFGQLVQLDFVLVGGSAYLKGPTGGYQKMSAATVSSLYDPATILNPDKGVAKVLGTVEDPRTQAHDDGVYRVSGTVSKATVSSLIPGIASDVTATFLVSSDGDPYLRQARFEIPNGHGEASVTVELSEINTPVTVTAPV